MRPTVEFDAAVSRVIDFRRYILGPEVTAFEKELAVAAGPAMPYVW